MDQNGNLSAEDKQKLIDWLNKKQKHPLCPVCGHNDWSLGDHLLSGMIFTGGSLVVGGPTYPQAFIACNNCSYVKHFMAVPIGLLPKTGGGD